MLQRNVQGKLSPPNRVATEPAQRAMPTTGSASPALPWPGVLTMQVCAGEGPGLICIEMGIPAQTRAREIGVGQKAPCAIKW